MENERVPLEEMLKDYEEGTKLLSVCKEKISIARKKVEKINKDIRAANTLTGKYYNSNFTVLQEQCHFF